MSGIKPSTVVHPTVIEGPGHCSITRPSRVGPPTEVIVGYSYTILPLPEASDEDMGSKLSAQKNDWLKEMFKHAHTTQLPSSYHMLFLDTVYVVRPANATCMKLTGATARQKRKDMKLFLLEKDAVEQAVRAI